MKHATPIPCIKIVLLLAILCVWCCGCASLTVRKADLYQQEPYLYPATVDHESRGLAPLVAFNKELPPLINIYGSSRICHPETCLIAPPAFVGGLAAYVLIDRPVAIVSDTLMLPYDMSRIRKHNRLVAYWESLFDGDQPDHATMQQNYIPLSIDPYIERYLSRDHVDQGLLLDMIDAGVALHLIAANKHLDKKTFERLIAAAGNRQEIIETLSRNEALQKEMVIRLSRVPISRQISLHLAKHPNTDEEAMLYLADHTSIQGFLARYPATPAAALAKLPDTHDYAIAQHPNAAKKTLQRIAAKTDRALTLASIAGHQNADQELLEKLYQTGHLPVWRTLSENPRTPPHILGKLIHKADDALLQNLARRDDLAPEMLPILLHSEHPGVRAIMLQRDDIDPRMVHERALHETAQEPLRLLAAMTNLTEEVYGSIADKGEYATLLALARNPVVPETTLLRLLDQRDDQISRTVLNHPNAQLPTRQQALERIQRRYPRDRIGSAMLPEDYKQDGILFMANTKIHFHADGSVRAGKLAKDYELNTRDLKRVLFRKGQTVRFPTEQLSARSISFPAIIHGMPCRSVQTHHRRGFPSKVVLDADHEINGIHFAAGASIRFTEHGDIRSFRSPAPTQVDGILCAANQNIRLHENGKLNSVHLAKPQVIDGVWVSVGQRIVLGKSGELQRTDQSRMHTDAAQRLQRDGELPAALERASRALAKAPSDIRAMNLKGRILLDMEEPLRAHAVFSRAVILQPQDWDALFGLGLAHARMNQHRKAIEYWSLCLALEDDHAPLYNRAIAHSQLGECAAALHDYNELYQIDPDYLKVSNNLAWLLATCHDDTLRDGRRAHRLAKAEVEKDRSWFTLDTLAVTYAERGRFRRAERLQEEALELLRAQDEQTMAEHLDAYEARLQSYRNRKPWRTSCCRTSEVQNSKQSLIWEKPISLHFARTWCRAC